MGAVCVRAWEQTDIVQLICFMCVCWLKTEKACMHCYVPTIHPWKQTVTDRMALFIKSSRYVTSSRQPKATKRPSRLSLQPRPPCSTSDWKYFKSSKQKSKVSFTADLTNRIKSWTGGLHFTKPLFYDFLFVLVIVKVTLLHLRKQHSIINHVSYPLNVCEKLLWVFAGGWLTVCAGTPIRR